MRLHCDRDVTRLLRKPENGDLRDMLRSLLDDPRPGWAQPVQGMPSGFEFNSGGYWFLYEIDETGGETVVRVTLP